MRQIVHGKNMEVTPALNEYAKSRLGKLNDWYENEGEMQINLAVQGHKQEHTVEATILLHGLVLRVEEKQDDMYCAIDLAADKLERQFRKLKEKVKSRERKQVANKEWTPGKVNLNEDDEESYEVVRTKSVQLKPVYLQEAILQMKLLDHDFHLFHNRETDRTELVYKRRDGSFGHISQV